MFCPTTRNEALVPVRKTALRENQQAPGHDAGDAERHDQRIRPEQRHEESVRRAETRTDREPDQGCDRSARALDREARHRTRRP